MKRRAVPAAGAAAGLSAGAAPAAAHPGPLGRARVRTGMDRLAEAEWGAVLGERNALPYPRSRAGS